MVCCQRPVRRDDGVHLRVFAVSFFQCSTARCVVHEHREKLRKVALHCRDGDDRRQYFHHIDESLPGGELLDESVRDSAMCKVGGLASPDNEAPSIVLWFPFAWVPQIRGLSCHQHLFAQSEIGVRVNHRAWRWGSRRRRQYPGLSCPDDLPYQVYRRLQGECQLVVVFLT